MSVDGLGVHGWKAIVVEVGVKLLYYRVDFQCGFKEWIANSMSRCAEVKMEESFEARVLRYDSASVLCRCNGNKGGAVTAKSYFFRDRALALVSWGLYTSAMINSATFPISNRRKALPP